MCAGVSLMYNSTGMGIPSPMALPSLRKLSDVGVAARLLLAKLVALVSFTVSVVPKGLHEGMLQAAESISGDQHDKFRIGLPPCRDRGCRFCWAELHGKATTWTP